MTRFILVYIQTNRILISRAVSGASMDEQARQQLPLSFIHQLVPLLCLRLRPLLRDLRRHSHDALASFIIYPYARVLAHPTPQALIWFA